MILEASQIPGSGPSSLEADLSWHFIVAYPCGSLTALSRRDNSSTRTVQDLERSFRYTDL